jgi:hypothetical protein
LELVWSWLHSSLPPLRQPPAAHWIAPKDVVADDILQSLGPLNIELLTYLYARRARTGDSTDILPRFRSVQEVPITELRTHPDLISVVSRAAYRLKDVQEGIVLGFYALENEEGRIIAVATGCSYLVLRVGPARLDELGVVSEPVEGLSEEWQAVDAMKCGTERLQKCCSLALEYGRTS